MTARPDTAQPRPLLRWRDAIAIIVGIVIGAGIFKTPSMVAGVTGDVGWAHRRMGSRARMVSLAGALCYAELATAYPACRRRLPFPHARLRSRTSFLYAWARATVINTGAIALLAFVFGDYVATVLPARHRLGRNLGGGDRDRADARSTSWACAHRHAPRTCSR